MEKFIFISQKNKLNLFFPRKKFQAVKNNYKAMNNENPVPFPKAGTEPMEIEPTKTEQAEKQKEGRGEADNVIKPEEEYADSGTGAEKIEEEKPKTSEETQEKEQQEKRDVKDSKWDGFGDKELEIKKYREKYAGDLKLEGNFGIKECEMKEAELNPGENSEVERNEADDDFIEALDSVDMSQLDKEGAALTVGELELMAKECEGVIKIGKINYLLKLEKCLSAEGDDRKDKIEEFISKDHPIYLKSIIKAEIILKGINKMLEELQKKATEENPAIVQEEHSKEIPQEGFANKVKALGEKAWKGGKKVANGLVWIGAISIFGLSRIFSWKKLDKWVKKVTGKSKVPFGMESSDDKK